MDRPDESPPPPNLLLLGTHSTIYPWYPPRSVPDSFLQSLRTQLESMLVERLEQDSYLASSPSNQSSPRSSIGDGHRPADLATWRKLSTVIYLLLVLKIF